MPAPAPPAKARPGRPAAAAQLALALALVSAISAAPAAAQVESVAAPASIQTVTTPGIALHIPADGRLNGNGFAAQVTGYRFANQVGYGPAMVKATRSQRLLVFGLQTATVTAAGTTQTDSQSNATPAVSALLDVDGAQLPLPAAAGDPNAPTYFLASIPAAATDVDLQLAAQGFTQTFSFTTGTRQGVQPAVLYRSQDSWEATDPVGQTVTMATPDPAENLSAAAIDVTLNSARLTWFGPDSPGHNPPAADQAWLVLDMKSQPHPIAALAVGFELNYLSTLSPTQVTLSVPGQPKPVPATITGQGGPADESQDQSGFFAGVYYWPVPADLTTATVKVTPGAITAEKNYLGSPQTITVPGSATFPVSFGPPFEPPPPTASPPADAAGMSPPAALTSAPARGSSSGFPLLGLVTIPVALVVGAAGFVTRRRLTRSGHRTTSAAEAASEPPPDPVAGRRREPTADPVASPSPQPAAAPGSDSQMSAPWASNGSPRPPLLVPPTAAPEPPAGSVRVEVFGTPSISGWPPGSPAGQSVVEIVAFLVLHRDQRFTAEQIQTGIAVGRPRDLSAESIRRYINEARRAIGEHHVPEIKAGEGYWLRDVTSDAAQMADLFDQAQAESAPAARARLLADGLALVRGAPFAAVPKGTFGWADTDRRIAPRMGSQIRESAVELTRLALDAADPALATWAADKGMLLWPTDDDLLEPLLAAARLRGVPELEVAWTHLQAHLARHDSEPSDRLQAAYHRLRDEGFHVRHDRPPG